MTFAEFDAYVEADAMVNNARQQVASPCADCTAAFATAMRAVGCCDGEPRDGRIGRMPGPNPTAMQLAWRERAARRKARMGAVA